MQFRVYPIDGFVCCQQPPKDNQFTWSAKAGLRVRRLEPKRQYVTPVVWPCGP